MSKKGGKERIISAPDDRLKGVQRKIANLLDELYAPRNVVHGFVRSRSINTNAESHVRSKYVVNLDIADFFPTITEGRVIGLLSSFEIDRETSETIARIVCNNGSLPQGAPSSPVISNMICFRMDKRLLQLAREARCIYTRYADDVTLSSYQPPSLLFESGVPAAGRFHPDQLAASLRGVFEGNGFALNAEKAHYADRHSRRIVTGLKVNEGVNVDRRYVRNIRAALHSVHKLGVPEAQKVLSEKYRSGVSIALHLQGKIAWLGNVKGRSDPVFRSMALRFNEAFPDYALKLLPTPNERRDRAVWIVEHFDGEMSQGTAFFLKSSGLITAAHCVEQGVDIEVYHPSKPANRFKATVSRLDAHRDLAVLKHEIPKTEFYELDVSSREIQVGQALIAAGYPSFGPGDKINIRSGAVSSLPVKSLVPMIEVTQKLAQGMSGGPLLDSDGAVAGVIHRGGPNEARDFAVAIRALIDWLNT